jgi:hypothetical protein
MFVDGTTSEFNSVQQMQSGDDLQNAWMMFNHVKRVQRWTTMSSHVYDLVYCKVMTIVVCDRQSKDTEAQCILWRKLNLQLLKKEGWVRLFSKGSWHMAHKQIGM